MKKIITVLFMSLIIIAGMCTVAFSEIEFKDVSSSFDSYKAIDIAVSRGVMQGYSKDYFKPSGHITRAEFSAVLFRALKAQSVGNDQNFYDVPSDHWAVEYINTMFSMGIINGVGNDNFDPNGNVTYSQAVKMLVCALGYTQEQADQRGGYPDGYIAIGSELGIDNRFKKDFALYRANVAQMLYDCYLIEEDNFAPIASSKSGEYPYGTFVALSAARRCTIHYTLDGSTPTVDSDVYSHSLDFDHSVILKAIAVHPTGTISEVSTYEYTIEMTEEVRTFYNMNKENKARPDINNYAEEIEEKCRKIIDDNIKPGMTDLEKEAAIHDYIVKNTRYDIEHYLAYCIPNDSYTYMGVIYYGIGVCQGYAEATKHLLNMAGIECEIIFGTAQGIKGWEGHSWNIVKIDGKWYHVDTTFDDPVPDQGDSEARHTYFNISDEEIFEDHKWTENKFYHSSDYLEKKDEKIGTVITVPNIVGMDYNDAISKLLEVGFKSAYFTEYNDNVVRNQVIEQTPEAGIEATYQDTIEFVVSKGKEGSYIPTISLQSEAEVRVDDTIVLEPEIFPENEDISWASSKSNVAYVDQFGNVTGLKAGTAVITVSTEDDRVQAQCIVTVYTDD